jgi:hypothetical protein
VLDDRGNVDRTSIHVLEFSTRKGEQISTLEEGKGKLLGIPWFCLFQLAFNSAYWIEELQ